MNSPRKSYNIKVPKIAGNCKEGACEKTNLHKEREKRAKTIVAVFRGFRERRCR